MNKDHCPIYGVVIVAGSALAVWAGMPVIYLVFLGIPLMMLFMMKGMMGSKDSHSSDAPRSAAPHEDAQRPEGS